MQFQDEDIQKLARLSRLSLTPQEVEKYRDQLTSVLQYVDQITTVSLDETDADIVYDAEYREDVQSPPEATRDELLGAAPKTDEGHVSVPNVK